MFNFFKQAGVDLFDILHWINFIVFSANLFSNFKHHDLVSASMILTVLMAIYSIPMIKIKLMHPKQ